MLLGLHGIAVQQSRWEHPSATVCVVHLHANDRAGWGHAASAVTQVKGLLHGTNENDCLMLLGHAKVRGQGLYLAAVDEGGYQ